jgi:hypothetical protein
MTPSERLNRALARLRAATETLTPEVDPWARFARRLECPPEPGLLESFVLSARGLLLVGGVAAALGLWTYHRARERSAELILRFEAEAWWQP